MSRLDHSSLYQLTSTRFRLFLREPEAIFWVFIFPILLAVGLGIAFRNRPADVLPVGATSAMFDQSYEGRELWRIIQMSSHDVLEQYFEHDRVRAHFARVAGENLV